MAEPLNLRDFEALARERMAAGAFAYYAGGAGDEDTLRANEAAFARRRLRSRVLVDVSQIDMSTTLLGERVAMPVGVAPTAQHRLAHADGEAATARAAARAGVMFCASTSASLSLEEIAAAAGPLRWFQLYTQDNAGPRTAELLRRAEAAGYRAIVLTVDLAVSGLRERELREGFDIGSLRFGNFPPPAVASEEDAGNGLRNQASAFSWADLAWLRAQTGLPIVLKGILTAADALLAVEHGAAAVWVSNHGARQLDRSPASIDVLEEIVDAVAGRVEVYLDGGVRRGIDVVTPWRWVRAPSSSDGRSSTRWRRTARPASSERWRWWKRSCMTRWRCSARRRSPASPARMWFDGHQSQSSVVGCDRPDAQPGAAVLPRRRPISARPVALPDD